MSKFANITAPGVMQLRPYIPGKPIEELERELGITNSLKLASNENPLGPSPLGMAAAEKVIGQINYYPDDLAFRLRNKLADRLGVQPECLVMGNGSSDVLDMVARAFLNPGVNAVFPEHSFAMYPIFTIASGASVKASVVNPATHDEMPLGADLTSLYDAIDHNTRVVFLANPNNPTGTWIEADQLLSFIRSLPAHVIMVLDEAYIEYVTDPGFANGIAWLEEFPNLIVTRTFSKLYGLAGLRIGYGVANPELVNVVSRLRHPFNANLAALAAAEAALDDEDFIRQSREVNSAGLKQLQQGLEAMGLTCIPSKGNFVLVDVKRDGAQAYQDLLQHGVIVRPVANYHLPNHLRITVGRAEENDRLLNEMEALIKQ